MDNDPLIFISEHFIYLTFLNMSGLKRACVHGGLLNVGKSCTNLEYLILRDLGSMLSDDALWIFAENCKRLNLVDIFYGKLSDNGLLSLSELKYLRVLIVESCPLLTTDGISK
jgi:hypothetical protein